MPSIIFSSNIFQYKTVLLFDEIFHSFNLFRSIEPSSPLPQQVFAEQILLSWPTTFNLCSFLMNPAAYQYFLSGQVCEINRAHSRKSNGTCNFSHFKTMYFQVRENFSSSSWKFLDFVFQKFLDAVLQKLLGKADETSFYSGIFLIC